MIFQREAKRAGGGASFVSGSAALASPFAQTPLPQSTLCKRVLPFESEMFPFVAPPQVPCETNAAARRVRPRVIARKISGGTGASAGSRTMGVLSSFFATWQLRSEAGLAACRKMFAEAQKAPVAAPA